MDGGGGWSSEPEAAEVVAVPTRWMLAQSASNVGHCQCSRPTSPRGLKVKLGFGLG